MLARTPGYARGFFCVLIDACHFLAATLYYNFNDYINGTLTWQLFPDSFQVSVSQANCETGVYLWSEP